MSADIQIQDIEKELKALWTLSKEKKQIKACLFTLIIYAQTARSSEHLQQLTDSILDKFPCRIIFIYSDQTKKNSYLHVKASTIFSGQTNTIACDFISINASFDMLERIPLIITPNIVPDLPVYLLWGQNPFNEYKIFPLIQSYAKRVIFDSECSDNLNVFCLEMLKNLQLLDMEIMDINWALVSHWRDLFPQIFDTEVKIEELTLSQEIIIKYHNNTSAMQPHLDIRAIYLQGWLAARLGWTYKRSIKTESGVQVHYESKGHPIVILLSPESSPELSCGSIISIEICTSERNYFIQRKAHLSQAVIHISTKELCELPFTLSLPDVHRGDAFMNEIFYNQIGDQYVEMLKMIAEQKITPDI